MGGRGKVKTPEPDRIQCAGGCKKGRYTIIQSGLWFLANNNNCVFSWEQVEDLLGNTKSMAWGVWYEMAELGGWPQD